MVAVRIGKGIHRLAKGLLQSDLALPDLCRRSLQGQTVQLRVGQAVRADLAPVCREILELRGRQHLKVAGPQWGEPSAGLADGTGSDVESGVQAAASQFRPGIREIGEAVIDGDHSGAVGQGLPRRPALNQLTTVTVLNPNSTKRSRWSQNCAGETVKPANLPRGESLIE